MLRIALLLTIFLSFVSNSEAQSVSQDKDYRMSDHQPTELNRSAYEEAIDRKGDFRLDNTNFYSHPVYSYSFHANQINREGYILYDNEIEKYLNQLKDWILNSSDEYKKKSENIHVYLMDKPSINAFTNDYGNIYVNIETIARLDSEEELLYLLAHEIAHILEEHSFETEKQSRKLSTKIKGNEKSLLYSIHSFSQKQELSADKEALKLLKGRVPISSFSGLLGKLKSSGDPTHSGLNTYENIFFGNDNEQRFSDLLNTSLVDSLPKLSKSVDRYSTHPSIGRRMIQMYEFVVDEGEDKNEYTSTGGFDELKRQAQNLLLTTFKHDGLYIRALDYVIKSLKQTPEDEELLAAQVELLVLICQDKYIDVSSTYMINNHGEDYTDLNYLSFRNFLLGMNPIDFNLESLSAIEQIYAQNPALSGRFDHHQDNLYQLLFQNQSGLFKQSGDSYVFVSKNELDASLDTSWYENFYEDEELDSLIALGFEFSNVSDSALLIAQYIDQPISSTLVKNITDYKKRAELFEQNVSWDAFDIGDLDPVSFAKKYKRRKEYLYADHYNPNAKVALLGCDQYQILSIKNVSTFDENFYLDFQKTLELTDRVNEYPSHSNHTFDFSNNSSQSTSVSDNYLHRIGNIWLNELVDRPLIVSAVDTEIRTYFLDRGIEYITLQISIVDKHVSYGMGTFISFVELTFDLNNDGIVYMAKIGSKRKDRPKQIEQLTYSSNYHKTNIE